MLTANHSINHHVLHWPRQINISMVDGKNLVNHTTPWETGALDVVDASLGWLLSQLTRVYTHLFFRLFPSWLVFTHICSFDFSPANSCLLICSCFPQVTRVSNIFRLLRSQATCFATCVLLLSGSILRHHQTFSLQRLHDVTPFRFTNHTDLDVVHLSGVSTTHRIKYHPLSAGEDHVHGWLEVQQRGEHYILLVSTIVRRRRRSVGHGVNVWRHQQV